VEMEKGVFLKESVANYSVLMIGRVDLVHGAMGSLRRKDMVV
jgi:hypothetical protein